MRHVNCLLWPILLWIYNASALDYAEELSNSLSFSKISKERFNSLFQVLKSHDSFDSLKSIADIYYYGSEFSLPNYELALENYLKAYSSNQSDSDVLFMIGFMYGYGIGCDIDSPKGLMFILASARLGNIKAQNALGFDYQHGVGLTKNCMYSRAYYLSSAKKLLKRLSPKDAVAIRKPVRLSIKSSDFEKIKAQQEALEYYEYSARGGDASASILLAQLYYFGTDGTDPDYGKARFHFTNSLAFGHDAAYGFLGQIYYRGEGIDPDFSKAHFYFLKGAERNIPSALNGLGLMYWHGHVVDKDLDSAEAYFKRAADLEYPEAYYNYAMVILEQPTVFTTEKVFQNILAAVKSGYVIANFELVKRYLKTETSCTTSLTFLKQIIDKGDSLELFKVSNQYFVNGFEDQALSRYMLLAAQGFEVANYNAAFILEKSKDFKHFSRATLFYSRSALMNNSESRRKVGDVFYRLGDPVSAVAHYVIAARSDSPDPEALFNLGYAYETGIGLNLDLWSAMDMYSISLRQGKSGKLAINLVMFRLRLKIMLNSLRKLINPSMSKYEQRSIKSQKDTDKLFTMLITLILISVIYWYFNYYQIRPITNAILNDNDPQLQYRSQSSSGSSASLNSGTTDSSSHSSREFSFKRYLSNSSKIISSQNDLVEEENDEVD